MFREPPNIRLSLPLHSRKCSSTSSWSELAPLRIAEQVKERLVQALGLPIDSATTGFSGSLMVHRSPHYFTVMSILGCAHRRLAHLGRHTADVLCGLRCDFGIGQRLLLGLFLCTSCANFLNLLNRAKEVGRHTIVTGILTRSLIEINIVENFRPHIYQLC